MPSASAVIVAVVADVTVVFGVASNVALAPPLGWIVKITGWPAAALPNLSSIPTFSGLLTRRGNCGSEVGLALWLSPVKKSSV